ncbi:hypothetical protein SESBI_21795 [Sesbania bispinosa]|nr:hypothetical protein SESBI_21795 [Sesbania bispinosa]
MVDVGDGRVQNLGISLENVLNHAPAIHPIDGTYENLVSNHHPALYLLQQRPHHAQQLDPLEASRRFFGDDDAHEVGLRSSDDADGLGFGERRVVFVGKDGSERGELLQGVLRFQEILVGGFLFRVLLPGDNWEAPEPPEKERGGGSHRAVAEDGGERCCQRHVSESQSH